MQTSLLLLLLSKWDGRRSVHCVAVEERLQTAAFSTFLLILARLLMHVRMGPKGPFSHPQLPRADVSRVHLRNVAWPRVSVVLCSAHPDRPAASDASGAGALVVQLSGCGRWRPSVVGGGVACAVLHVPGACSIRRYPCIHSCTRHQLHPEHIARAMMGVFRVARSA